MYHYQKLENLRDNVSYWQYRFDRSSPSEARVMLNHLNKAKQALKEYKQEHLPHLLEQPKITKQKEAFIRMSDWSETFEEYQF